MHQPLVSPDGRYWWDGAQWIPTQDPDAPVAAAGPPPAFAAPSQPSGVFRPLSSAPAGGCRLCHRTPAIPVTIRAHRGMIILMQFRTARGPFCRTCGMTVLKQMAASTALLGWWGVISLLFGAPFALLSDAYAWIKLRRLPAPA